MPARQASSVALQRQAGAYARSLLGVLPIDQAVAAVGELRMLAELAGRDADFAAMLQGAAMTQERQLQAISIVLAGRVSRPVAAVIEMLVEHRDGSLLPAVAEAASMAMETRRGVVPVEVTSACPLDAVQIEQVRRAMSDAIGRDAMISVNVDPSIIGGLTVQYDDTVFDASASRGLSALRQSLLVKAESCCARAARKDSKA